MIIVVLFVNNAIILGIILLILINFLKQNLHKGKYFEQLFDL